MIELYVLGIVSSVTSSIAAIVVCGVLADRKGRSVGGWIVGAIFLGWIAVLILALIQNLPVSTRRISTGREPFYKIKEKEHDVHKRCPQCGEIVKSATCEMCGYTNKLFDAHPTIQVSPTIKKPNESSHKCVECGEMINTKQCPYCGWRDK